MQTAVSKDEQLTLYHVSINCFMWTFVCKQSHLFTQMSAWLKPLLIQVAYWKYTNNVHPACCRYQDSEEEWVAGSENQASSPTDSEEETNYRSSSPPASSSTVVTAVATSTTDECSTNSVTVSESIKGKKWDKQHACKCCHKMVIKMSDHLERVHKNEVEVARVLAMKKGSRERRTAWGELSCYDRGISYITMKSSGQIQEFLYQSIEVKKRDAQKILFLARSARECTKKPTGPAHPEMW